MKLITGAQLARLAGVSAQAISELKRKGKLRRVNGKYDLHDVRTADYLAARKEREDKADEPEEEITIEARQGHAPLSAEQPVNGNGHPIEDRSRREVEKQKLIEQVLNYQVKTQKERGELLDRHLTKRVMAKIFAVDTAELQPLGEKIAADIAAKFKSDDSQAILETRQIIDRHIFNALQHIKRLMNDYFDQIGESKL